MGYREVIDYWRVINNLSPVEVRGKKISQKSDFNILDDNRRWIKRDYEGNLPIPYNEKMNSKQKIFIEIVCGNIKNEELYSIANIEEDHIVDGDSEKSFIWKISIELSGEYIQKSFEISHFFYIVLNKLYHEEIDYIEKSLFEFNEKIDEIIENQIYRTVDDLNRLYTIVLDQLGLTNIDSEMGFYLRLEKEGSFDNAILQKNFYGEDLKFVKDNMDESHFINSIIVGENKGRRKIDDDVDFLKEVLMPENMPRGKWPSKFNPSMMQAVAIYISTNEKYKTKVFSVNGPPGTGKTTLLKEIIAENIIKKAKFIADHENINSTIKKISTGSPKYYKNYYDLPEELKELGILIASNNNSAVENISLELPLSEDVKAKDTLTGYFDVDKNENIYFTSLANKLFSEDDNKSWGLISATYGKINNIKKIINILPEKFTPVKDIKFELDDDFLSFDEAKKKFKEKYDEIEKEINILNDFAKEIYKIKDDIKEIESSNISLLKSDNNMEIEKHELNKERDNCISKIKAYNNLIDESNKNRTIAKKIKNFFSKTNDEESLKYKGEIDSLLRKINNIEIKISKIEEKISLRLKYEKKKSELEKIKKEICDRISLSENDSDWFRVFDDDYFKDIERNEKTQESCPWVYEELNIKREELFYLSLQLIQAFIMTNDGIKHNLKLLPILYDRSEDMGYNKEERRAVLNACFHTLNFLIPVLSTTFASVQNAFSTFGKSELGTVLVDEAGQATPLSAMGLLFRSKSCIIVGDPLQVEPIITTPSSLNREAFNTYLKDKEKREFKIGSKIINLSYPEISLQVLADSVNPYYGKIGSTEVGCPLVIHRRCISPMFEISNRISYDDRMINKTFSKDKKFALDSSSFINVKGKENGNRNHYVKEQGEKVIEIIEDAIKKGIKIFESADELYIISPFKSVANEMKKTILKKYGSKIKWAYTNIGTVHKFQGKAANSVIILLGCDDTAKNAAKWAANEPNILNVAVSRAKYRIAIIGDKDLWEVLPNFDIAIKILESQDEG
ncbi:MAG: AAA domain-containing protein [Tissierellia bacterium]|nr:AAA domain-containing protein [Tissierellia bacterium]